MVLCDSNVWLALALSKHAHHTAARACLGAVEEPASVFAAFALTGRYSMVTTDAAFRQSRGMDLLVLGR